MRGQGPWSNALRAAATAASTSALSPSDTSVMTDSSCRWYHVFIKSLPGWANLRRQVLKRDIQLAWRTAASTNVDIPLD